MASTYTPLPVHVSGRAFHSQVFARVHVSRANDTMLPAKRTMFLLNVPLHVSAEVLAAAFAHKGSKPTVHLTDSGGSRSAHVVFDDQMALKRAMAPKKPIELPPAFAVVPTSSANTISQEELHKQVSAFMEEFEAAERKRQEEEEAQHNQMDSDGYAGSLVPIAHAIACLCQCPAFCSANPNSCGGLCVPSRPQIRACDPEKDRSEHEHRGRYRSHRAGRCRS